MIKINFKLTLCLFLSVAINLNAQLLNIVQLAQIGQMAEQIVRKPNFANQADDKFNCPIIKTTLGAISGIRQKTVLGNGTFCSYRGIRYAEAPIGKLRFKVYIFY